ncbi:peroxinectin A-like [Actinia tenebrosa]|uniref:Peroxinectin A-like n=1 Tax=Actinia tenebrosa TaxID=6105 RepID=A0A6P8J5C4_ACTTE|nr:peroxinectin A-like [Actinia tenebrosa]
MIDDLRNVLFPVGRHNGLDLAAMNIQRGRDHGLPDYNTVRKMAGLPGLKDFSDLVKNKRVAQDMKSLYGHVDNIDLWVGGLAEEHEKGSELGRTFRTILTNNFLKIRDGDRFWYQKILDPQEIKMVHGLTLGRIIRLNTNIKNIPDNVFFSTQYCAGVENYQCKPRDPLPLCRNDTSVGRKEHSTNQEYGSNIFIGLALLSSVSFVVNAFLIFLWLRERKSVRTLQSKNSCKVENEMHSFTNTVVKEDLEV